MANKRTVLFLCTGNSARSQIAEGLLRHLAGDRFDALSAGTDPKGLHPQTVIAMKEMGIDVSGHRSKDVKEFLGRKFDYVITVCDRAKQQCPIFPGAEPIHWEFDDPAAVPAAEQARAFARIREEIHQRLSMFLLAQS
jgi:arsenate reductase